MRTAHLRFCLALIIAGVTGADVLCLEARESDSRYEKVSLETLSAFEADWLDPEMTGDPNTIKTKSIPSSIQRLNGKHVAISGFVYPMDPDSNEVSDFFLVKYIPGCFFCEMPRVNDWIKASFMKPEKLGNWLDKPVTIFGILEVSQEVEDGYVTSLYRMKVDRMETES